MRWFAIASATLAAAVVGVAVASAAPTWHDGTKVTSSLQNACLGNVEFGAAAYAGFRVDPSNLPATGQVFYGHAVFGAAAPVGGTGCGNTDQHAEVDLVLPRGVSLAVSAAHPMYCFHEDTGAAEVRDETCPTRAISGTYGPALPPRDGQAAWDLPVGRLFEIQFPLVTTRQLRGPAGGNCPEALSELRQRNDCLVAAVHVADGDTDPWLLPSVTMATGAGSASHLVARLAPVKGQTLTAALRAKALSVTCSLGGAGRCSVQAAIPAATARGLGLAVPRSAQLYVLGTGRASLSGAGRRLVRVPLSAAARAALRHASSLAVTFALTASAGSARTTKRMRITLRR